MSGRSRLFCSVLIMILITWLLEYTVAAKPEKRTLNIQLQPVHKDTPVFSFSNNTKPGSSYPIRLIKIRDNPLFKSLPDIEANTLYYGEVKLGSPARTHGILIDFEGKEKLLWADSDADHNFAGEIGYRIFKSDRVPGTNYYFSPTPIGFQVAFDFEGRRFESLIQFNLPFFEIARTSYQDYFSLITRTWFTGNIRIGETELRVGVVDTNNNGIYRDSNDLLMIDRDYDLNFTPKESNILAKTKTIKLLSERWNVSYDFLPEKLILTER